MPVKMLSLDEVVQMHARQFVGRSGCPLLKGQASKNGNDGTKIPVTKKTAGKKITPVKDRIMKKFAAMRNAKRQKVYQDFKIR
nr:hypothetical protein TetV2_00594 [Oceanusvirus sp.]